MRRRDKVYIALKVIIIFFGVVAIFVAMSVLFLPRRIAAMVVGLGGFTVLVVGPFWAMALEKRLKEKWEKKNKPQENDPLWDQFLAEEFELSPRFVERKDDDDLDDLL